MSFPNVDALTLIQSALLLLKEQPQILASPEDAAYFRMQRTKAPTPPPAPPVKSAPPLLPKFDPPIKVEAPPPTDLKPEPLPPKEPEPPLSVPHKPQRPASQLRSILQKIAPELALLDAIPNDETAKQIANRWKTKNQSAPISILSSGELPQHKDLLAEIATALDVHFGAAKLIVADSIEKEKQWKTFLSVGNLKLVIICDSTLWQLHQLRQFYKETPATGVRMLGEVPIFLLPDLSLYLKDPLLKRSLWKALCSRLS